MKTFRKKIFLRSFSIFFTVVFFNSLFYPIEVLALTSGPHQPEYTSYEDASSSDMVNLLTGDFNFNLPIFSVPVGSEGVFTVPLSYHAGISPDQEASWVGLGWNINVGSLTRNINGFPDDADGETQIINVKDLDGKKGWSINFPGLVMGWDSDEGHYGVHTAGPFSATWNKEGTTVGLGGIYVGEQGRIDAVELAMTVVRVVVAIVTLGASELGLGMAMSIATDAFKHIQMSSNFSPPQGPSTAGHWAYSSQSDSKFLGIYSTYKYWLDKTRYEDMYGSLYLDNAPSVPHSDNNNLLKIRTNFGSGNTSINQFMRALDINSKGAASDVNIDLSQPGEYYDNTSPVILAYDNFSVRGPGVSGNITPYRLEIGSVAVPREMSSSHYRFNPVPFLDYGTKKVPFIFSGDIGNNYFHHSGMNSNEPALNYSLNSTKLINGAPESGNTDVLQYDLSDPVFQTQRIRTDINSTKRLPQSQYVDWLTNGEIKNATGKFPSSPYTDYFRPADRQNFRTNFQYGGRKTYFGTSATSGIVTLQSGQSVSQEIVGTMVTAVVVTEYRDPDGRIIDTNSHTWTGLVSSVSDSPTTGSQIVINNSNINLPLGEGHIEVTSTSEPKRDGMIGGFVVTGAGGMNYHYALPIYDYDWLSKTVDKNSPANKYSSITRSAQFANTWVLTAITGPDFIDRGGVNNLGDGYIDESDWGYWVKFNYGTESATSNVKWRFPYEGTRRDSDNNHDSYSEGYKERYFLNSIETRSHVALFVKNSRLDALDAAQSAKKQSLRLDEIVLLTKDVYRILTDQNGTYQLKDCSGKIDGVYKMSGAVPSSNNFSGARLTYAQANALRRIKFNYDYSLCSGALNSTSGSGKLTLKSVSVFGKNSVKVMPDFKFEYANNPAYGVNKWDGWGMYNSGGTVEASTHKVSAIPADGTAWSLTSIRSPLGHAINIQYERDSYASVSGEVVKNALPSENMSNVLTNNNAGTVALTNSNFLVGDIVNISGSFAFRCYSLAGWQNVNFNFDAKIISKNGNVATIDAGTNYLDIPCNTSPTLEIASFTGVVRKRNKVGGDIRVASITLTDNQSVNVVSRYLYEYDNGLSSGVVSMEPEYIREDDGDHSFYKQLSYPATPVIYGRIIVMSGGDGTVNNHEIKRVFEFETPHKSQYTINSDFLVKDKQLMSTYEDNERLYRDRSTLLKRIITDRTAKIGKLKSIAIYDKDMNYHSGTEFFYTESIPSENEFQNQGVFSQGTLLFEALYGATRDLYHRAQRTTLIKYPYVLYKTVNTVDGLQTEEENIKFDFLTGNPIETTQKSALGYKLKTVVVPLYKIPLPQFAELGSKALNPINKNMLSQVGASYTYKLDAMGNETGLLAASATTWKNDWSNYSVLVNGNYVNSQDLDFNGNGTVDANEQNHGKVWRKYQSYLWEGEYSGLNADGSHTFNAANKFDFATTAVNPGWTKGGTFEKFDHYSNILETSDHEGRFSSQKMSYPDHLPLAVASNAAYDEIAFSSAEDRLSPSSPYFGGQVAIGQGTVVSTSAHTGTKALQLASGYGFVYKSPSVVPGKKYRASVWCNSSNGKIYYKINGGAEQVPLTQTVSIAVLKKDGTSWYRINLDIPVPSSQSQYTSIEVGVKSGTGTSMLFDDFRFQPVHSSMSGNVYDPVTQQIMFILDDDNLFTRFEYNNRGQVYRTYKESITYGEKLVSEVEDNFKRFNVDQ